MTLAEIAEQHGWTFTAGNGGRSYEFGKGDLRVVFSRSGHGWLHVTWHGYRVPWDSRIGENIRIYQNTREEYAAALLPLVTEEGAKRAVEESLRHDVEARSAALQNAQGALGTFLSLTGGV
jgi:hypothetical protein